jgi:thymidylate synthase
MTQMKPFVERDSDWQYLRLLSRIMTNGFPVMSQQDEKQYRIIGYEMRFPLENGFPLITERDVVSEGHLDQALGELCAFLNGVDTLDGLAQFGNFWWKRWATEKKCAKRGLPAGNLGPGSYGRAWRNFPAASGSLGSFDQFKNIIEQMQEFPQLLTHFISPWIPQYTIRGEGKVQKVVVAPCHGWLHFILDSERKDLYLNHFQRSADAPVGLVYNIAQYAALAMMVAQVLGYTAKELVCQISCPHIFERQLEPVRELLRRDPRPFPTMTLDPDVKDLFAFRKEHFRLTDYDPHPAMKILTPV